jgi:hypothetical protein
MLRLADPGTARSMGAHASEFAATASWADVAGRILREVRSLKASHPLALQAAAPLLAAPADQLQVGNG